MVSRQIKNSPSEHEWESGEFGSESVIYLPWSGNQIRDMPIGSGIVAFDYSGIGKNEQFWSCRMPTVNDIFADVVSVSDEGADFFQPVGSLGEVRGVHVAIIPIFVENFAILRHHFFDYEIPFCHCALLLRIFSMPRISAKYFDE